MMEQYLAVKKTLPPNTVLFFRLGDFYEMFFEDAALASRILEIALTGREGGEAGRVPMCGVPYHASKNYIRRLIEEGLKVAICEQMEDARFAKGIVKREVTRIISQGTYVEEEEENLPSAQAARYLTALFSKDGRRFGLAYLDLGTGEFKVTEVDSPEDVTSELVRIHPAECIVPESIPLDSEMGQFLSREFRPSFHVYETRRFDLARAREKIQAVFRLGSLDGLGLSESPLAITTAGAILEYLEDHLHRNLEHLRRPQYYSSEEFMVLDAVTQRNLELTRPALGVSENRQNPTLFSVIDETQSLMGARTLRLWLLRPLLSPARIGERLEAVKVFVENSPSRAALRGALRGIRDMERITGRLNCALGNARDLVMLANSLERIPEIKQALEKFSAQSTLLKQLAREMHELRDLAFDISRAFVEAPPPAIQEGGMVRMGYSPELDALKNICLSGQNYLAALQKREMERTGIKSLKVKYNKVFGYYIEISHANAKAVPAEYTRKQTLVNAERYIIPELKEYEEKVLTAQEKAARKEYEIFEAFRLRVRERIQEIQSSAQALGALDALTGLAETAVKHNYVMPLVTDKKELRITGGRHPVVEQFLPSGEFVENDTLLNGDDHQFILITGPNMAGKSTYIRQVALITLLAQAGSFVPAARAEIGVADRIFTRIGASDALWRGQSTFMVEMAETANILHHATSRSLIIMDEIGRGTSTFDGVSIAWSVCEYLASGESPRPRALFATHYHELTKLESLFEGIKNYRVTVHEGNAGIVFLRKIVRGGTDKSYGIHVARLAGLPDSVIARARQILEELERSKMVVKKTEHRSKEVEELSLF
ncbi:MAG: DNA mismatch repair protein MutS [Candidatus Omnitrophica bacterium]|nr:DNA mismatch repair protein MutS [Candidatus Omnitrophota bacterium]